MGTCLDSIKLAKNVCNSNDLEAREICEQAVTEELDAYTVGMDCETRQLFYWEAYDAILNLRFKNYMSCAEDLFFTDISEVHGEELSDVYQCTFDNTWDEDNARIAGELVYLGEEMTFSEALDTAFFMSLSGADRFEYGLIDIFIDVYENYGRQDDVERMTSFRNKVGAHYNPYM